MYPQCTQHFQTSLSVISLKMSAAFRGAVNDAAKLQLPIFPEFRRGSKNVGTRNSGRNHHIPAIFRQDSGIRNLPESHRNGPLSTGIRNYAGITPELRRNGTRNYAGIPFRLPPECRKRFHLRTRFELTKHSLFEVMKPLYFTHLTRQNLVIYARTVCSC